MTIRLQITFFLILISLIGVIGTSFFILQTAITDKKNYVTELNSVLSPQIKDSIDQKVQTLLFDLKDFSDMIENPSAKKNVSTEKYIESLKLRLKHIEAIFIFQLNQNIQNKLITIKLGTSPITENNLRSVENLMKSSKFDFIIEESLTHYKDQLYLFKTSHNNVGLILLNPDFFKNSFELARGKKSLLVRHQINTQNLILYSAKNDPNDLNFVSKLPLSSLKGAELSTQELKDEQNISILTNYSKLKSIQESYVLIASPQITWQDLVAPLLKSSISLILILILISVIIAYYISRSLAQPIELLTEETSKIGIGEWKTISLINSKNEIAKLGIAFNRMIFNLINRENELKIAHNKLIQSESLAAVGRISAGIAHEVKNPLSSILGYCQLIDMNFKTFSSNPTPTTATEKLDKMMNYNKLIMDDTRRASRIISDLLTFSRQKVIQPEKTNLNSFMISIEPKLKALCEAHTVHFSFENQANADTTYIQIDSEQIYQVLFNLVQNAVHAVTSTENPDKTIKLMTYLEVDGVSIEVRDNGPGIRAEHITKIFEPFFSTKKVGEGSGLGLAICYGIISQHNGQILVESIPQQNTCFKVQIPLLK